MDIPRQRLFSDRQLTKLIVPLIVEQALAILVGLVDGVMVSVVGESEMSGVSLVNNFSNIILTLFAGLACEWIGMDIADICIMVCFMTITQISS